MNRWNLVQAFVVGAAVHNFNLALWLEQASEVEIEDLWRSRVESDNPSFVFFSGPAVLDIVGWLALRYKYLEPVYYKAKMGSKNITLQVGKKDFEKWLRDSRHKTIVKQAVDTLLGQHFELPESV